MNMKITLLFLSALPALLPVRIQAQGTLNDQQAGPDGSYGEVAFGINALNPAQAFTPALTAVDFVTLYIYNGTPGITGTLYVNLRQDSVTGAILATSVPITLTPQSSGPTEFLFSAPVAVVPGTPYYIEPKIQSGSLSWGITGSRLFNYPGGTAYQQGMAAPDIDLWFREGISIPEPSSIALLLFPVGCLL
jgi:hypothetical protein